MMPSGGSSKSRAKQKSNRAPKLRPPVKNDFPVLYQVSWEKSHEYFRAEEYHSAGNCADSRDARSDWIWRGLVARGKVQARKAQGAGLDSFSIGACQHRSYRDACVRKER